MATLIDWTTRDSEAMPLLMIPPPAREQATMFTLNPKFATAAEVPEALSQQSESTIRSRALANLDTVHAYVRSLLDEEQDDEAGTGPPTQHAYDLTLQVLADAQRLMLGVFPLASPSSDERGTVYIYWAKPGRSIHLTVPGDECKSPTLHYRDGTTSDVIETSSPHELSEILAHHLEWFAKSPGG